MEKDQVLYSGWKRQVIWEGCILASIAHAIFVANNPDFAYEHSWDGNNYSTNDGQGSRGTVTFGQDFFVGGFRNEEFSVETTEAKELLSQAPQRVQKIAEQDTFQYLLDEVDGAALPIVTTVLWGNDNQVFSSHPYDDMIEQGAHLLEIQASEYENGVDYWEEYYELREQQLTLLKKLYHLKLANPARTITLSVEDIQALDAIDIEGMKESKISFSEMGFEWPSK
ncbi:hypothetical protein [Exiguobacterium antarcticum]|uniref:Peptidase C39-like domain-containing protein n=1 Tax=Exiguobacterium antarcticum TaxID=132920 RepID=A0ABT6R588_9BACL|nr:hypothetical protein [Exiguobacterium antarcticum]AFS69454.1 Hypothetical protein Eab7_0292 [Exiguobacterium antarcticum B7]MDI3236121.1 hypothetical protein [Exiguobacterium antarcticum]